MKFLKKIAALLLVCTMSVGFCSEAFAAENVLGPVPVTFSNLTISPAGYIRFQMSLQENGIRHVPQYYDVYMDILTNGNWRMNYRHIRIPSTGFSVYQDVNFSVAGVYQFYVTCTFTGGQVSTEPSPGPNQRDGHTLSDTCTVTRDDIVEPEPDDRDHTGPGGGSYNPTNAGPGSSGSTPAAKGKSAWYQDPVTKKWYYAATTGTWLKNTWYFINNNWYYFDNDSSMHTGWLSEGGHWYYLHPYEAPEGHRASGFSKIDGKWYYFDPGTGIMQTGVIGVGGYIYCMDASGAMLVNEGTPDGHFYDTEGHRIR